jgi:FG-GAP-like repeat
MKRLGIAIFILILSGFLAPRCRAAIYQSNGTAASVQSIHNNQAHNGDTITLPAGILHWTTRVTISKAITLQGAGVGATVVRDGVQSGQLIQVTLVAGNLTRITGIEFQDGGRTNAQGAGGIVHVVGSNTNGSKFRFDHCKWNNLNGSTVFDTVIGVIDHNTFVTDRFSPSIYPYASYWNGQNNGDGSWSAPTGFGSSQFLFIEDNNFTHSQQVDQAVEDAFAGARFVVRHNNIFNGIIYNHGTESTGRTRGGRAVEAYNNTFTGTNLNKFVGGIRSGVVLFHDNSISGYWDNLAVFSLGNYRNFYPFPPWGGADGTNAWDVNSPTVFFTGTAAANSSGTTVTVYGANWPPNYWAGYTLRRTSNICNSGSISFSDIQSNTSNTITYINGGYPGSLMSFCAGDSLEIRKVVHALDQPGRALGSLITGTPPIRPGGWNNQVTEPCYSWDNTNEVNGQVNFSAGPGVRANEHYFNNTPMPGYAPYIYPHPLVSAQGGGGASPRASVTDFNSDGHPDYVLQNANTRQTAIWYLNNNFYAGGAYGPTLVAGWVLRGLADFNRDSHSDYALFAPNTNQTALWYLSGPRFIGSAYGPTLPNGWEFVGAADFNGDNKPDYVLYNANTRQTAIWYMNNNVHIGGGYGPTIPPGWDLIGVADFNGDGHPDYALIYAGTGVTAIGYLSGLTLVGAASGPTLPGGWALVATADFNGDGKPDYVLYNAGPRQTAIWYLNNNVFVGSAYGPTLPAGWSLAAP